MSLRIRRLTLGLVDTNAYLLGDSESPDAILIDPVDDAQRLVQAAADEGWKISLVLATHGHFDHVLASQAIKDLTAAPFRIHAADLPLLHRLPETGLRFVNQRFPEAAEPDSFLEDNEVIQFGSIGIHCLFTPGHAPGHMAFYLPDYRLCFSGDALFAGSIGRTDLPGADHALLLRSIETRLLTLADDVRILPGHGPETTIGRERHTNPWLQ